jgi:hypothetical protein
MQDGIALPGNFVHHVHQRAAGRFTRVDKNRPSSKKDLENLPDLVQAIMT